MKALLKIALISGLMTLASCAHHRHGGCGPSDKCPMGAKECKECCEKGKCDMKGAGATTTEEKKDETKK